MLLCPPEILKIKPTNQNNKVYNLQNADKTGPNLRLRNLDLKNERMPAISCV